MSAAAKNLLDIARSFTEIPAKVARAEAGGTFLPATIAKPAPQVRVIECWMCWGFGRAENGDRCFNCGGRGRVATDGGEV